MVAMKTRKLMALAIFTSCVGVGCALHVGEIANAQASDVALSLGQKVRLSSHIFEYIDRGNEVPLEIVSVMKPVFSVEQARILRLCRRLNWSEVSPNTETRYIAFLKIDGDCLQPAASGRSEISLMPLSPKLDERKAQIDAMRRLVNSLE
jgi:hypothetical protein